MLVTLKMDADFSQWCAHSDTRPLNSTTHPQHKRTGALAMRLWPKEGQALRYRGRRFSLG